MEGPTPPSSARPADELDALVQEAVAVRTTNPERAVALAARAADLARLHGDEVREALAEMQAGWAATRLARNADAARRLRRAGDTLARLGRLADAAQAHVRLALALLDLRRSDEALAALSRALDEPSLPSEDRVKALTLRGNIHLERGDTSEALRWHEAALKLCEDTDDREGRGIVLGNLGQLWALVGDEEQAARSFTEALATPPGDWYAAALVTLYLAELQERLERHGDALRSFEALERVGALNATFVTLGRAGRLRLLCHLGDRAGASELLARGVPLHGDDDVRARAWWRLGEALFEATFGSPDRVDDAAREATDLFARAAVPAELAFVHGLLARTFERLGDHRRAYEHLRRHHELDRAVRTAQFERRVQLEMLRSELRRARDEHARLEARARDLERQAHEDPLTNLLNRRGFADLLARRYREAAERGAPLGVVAIDIDHFKRVNDTFSHAAGDEVLRHLARHLRSKLGRNDVAARLGGEEFAVVLDGATREDAVRWCDALRASLRGPWNGLPFEARVTVSIGVCADIALGSGEAMLHAADVRLYEAKRSGRDRVLAT